MNTVDKILEHHGVRGMKWGVRRKGGASSGPDSVTVAVRGRRGIITRGGGGHPATQEAIKSAVALQKAKKSGTHSLSNDELKDLVNRMNLEQQYTKLEGQSRSKGPGAKFAAEVLNNVAKQQATRLVSDIATQEISKLLKR